MGEVPAGGRNRSRSLGLMADPDRSWRNPCQTRSFPPGLDFAVELRVNIGETLELGASSFGIRRTVPITGGVFHGPGLNGVVLPGGADWQLVSSSGLTLVDARDAIETDDGVRIEVRNTGVRQATPEVLDRIRRGEPVPASEYYFRTSPVFYPPDGPFQWLRESVYIDSGERYADLVVVRIWKVC